MVDLLLKDEISIIFDCGTEDFFLDVNRRFHKKLLDLKINHDYTERPGDHNSDYWKNSIDYQLLFFKKYFQ
jgi:enterochelin esterase-like enzyme